METLQGSGSPWTCSCRGLFLLSTSNTHTSQAKGIWVFTPWNTTLQWPELETRGSSCCEETSFSRFFLPLLSHFTALSRTWHDAHHWNHERKRLLYLLPGEGQILTKKQHRGECEQLRVSSLICFTSAINPQLMSDPCFITFPQIITSSSVLKNQTTLTLPTAESHRTQRFL